ncbi:MAG TPA: DEAD/DEAH box helicase [Candidatus Thermoplasmatota archaeon]|nr:DEAD/DEAH box helicase [Candidatus Thermoplasmatota archaeon]
MEESGLHPRLTALLRSQGWSGLTEAQSAAAGPLRARSHVLLVAPTGHGKTEAALLPVLSRILEERDALAAKGRPWPKGFKALYVTPLRALNRDLMGRLRSWAEALELGVAVRHGDTPQGERTRQARDPPDLLITTPETLQLLLYGDTLRRHLATVRFVIVDEVHELAASERGAQLLVALERLEEAIAQPAALRSTPAREREGPARPVARPGGGFQRIGLSATVADPPRIARWLAGRDRPIDTVLVEARKTIVLTVVEPEARPEDQQLASELALPPAVVAQVRTVRRIVREHGRVLVFHNTRDGAELLASRSAMLDSRASGHAGPNPGPVATHEGKQGPAQEEHDRPGDPPSTPLLGLHHGSLSAEHRADAEERFKAGELRGLVATSSLELGIDVGAIDHVVQVASPRSVARLVQRLGRSGHRVGGISSGTLVATGTEDAMECAAVARRASEGRLEPLLVRDLPLVVLANQLVALANEYKDVRKEWCREVVGRAGCFLDLDPALFDAVWSCLQEVKTLFPAEGRGGADRMARSGRARRHFLEHISLIPDERTYRVVDEASKRAIGTVDDAFVASSMAPGALIVMAGRSWRVLEVEAEAARVRVAPVRELGPVPQWAGSQLPVSFEVAQEVAALRRVLLEGGVAGAGARAYPFAPGLLDRCAKVLRDHQALGLAVATDQVVTLEVAKRLVVVNVALGTRGNEALGKITQGLLSQRLGAPVAMESDAYRIHLTFPEQVPAPMLLETWQALDPGSLDLLLSMLLRESPQVRHHLVHVAKQFGALPSQLDPNHATRSRIDALLQHPALEEETLSRLLHDRMDLAAVRTFVAAVREGRLAFKVQGTGPLTFLGQDTARHLLANPRTDDALLAAVRKRIEESDALMVCCACGNPWSSRVDLLPKRIACRRCQSIQVACLRPWNEEQARLLRIKGATPEEAVERERLLRNGALVASFGSLACRCLVARGVGPDTAARILQKASDPSQGAFWREILQAELTFARTNAFWRR